MNAESSEPTRLFPRGVVTLTIAGMLERFGYYMGISGLLMFLEEKLWSDMDTVGTLYASLRYSAAFLPVLCGLIGDFTGHRRGLVLGAAFAAGGFLLLALPLEGDDPATWLSVILGILLLASGRAFFPVSTVALIGHLYDSQEHRMPSAGAFTLLHVLTNAGALVAPFLGMHLGDLLADAADLNRFESTCAVLALASQPVIVALIIVAARRHLFAKAELAVREKIRERDPSPPPDGMARYAKAMLPLLLIGLFLFHIGYHNGFSTQFFFLHRVLDFGGDWAFQAITSLNPLVVVVFGPAAIIVYGVLRGRGKPVPAALLAALGMGAAGLGLLMMLPSVIDVEVDTFAPDWGDGGPSLFWPVVSITLVALGEILVHGLVPALVTSASPRRFRGLLFGVAFAVGSLAALLTSPFDVFFRDSPQWGVFTVLGVAALIGAGVVFVGGLIASNRGR
ncbi:MAG: MFS transporter [Deltaproteobacteria bacterium]|nr:MFS transporter [Deltaproteobacteria bacterium]